MRVITGVYKGRIINTVTDLSVRPATDRVRQTVFDMLANRIEFEGATVLDLFAGSGSLGIEALSRGAAHVTFVERGEEAVQHLKHNVRSLGCEAATEICEMDAMIFLKGRQSSYDLVFADPPYAFDRTEEIPQVVFREKMVKPQGYLIVEHSKDVRFEGTPLYRKGPEKRFGRTVVTFFQNTAEPMTKHELS